MDDDGAGSLFQRYSGQILVELIGREGQRKLLDSYVVLVGCGALGSTIASLLVRAGVGNIRIVGRGNRDLLLTPEQAPLTGGKSLLQRSPVACRDR